MHILPAVAILLVTFASNTGRYKGNLPMDNLGQKLREIRRSGSDPLAGFSLEIGLESGYSLAGLAETRTHLRLAGDGTLDLTRSDDQGNYKIPPGHFQATLPRTQVQPIELLVEYGLGPVPRDDQPPSPSGPFTTLKASTAGATGEVTWGGWPDLTGSPIQKILNILFNVADSHQLAPLWTVQLEPVELRERDGVLLGVLRFHNAGSKAVKIAHPASPGHSDQIQLQFSFWEAPKPIPGVTPLPIEPTRVSIASARSGLVEWIVLRPGGSWDLAIQETLPAKLPRNWRGVFRYRCHLPVSGGTPESFQGSSTSPEIKP